MSGLWLTRRAVRVEGGVRPPHMFARSDTPPHFLTCVCLVVALSLGALGHAQPPPPPPPLPFSHIQKIEVTGPGHVPCKNNVGVDLPNMTFYTEVDLGPAIGTPTAALRTRGGAPQFGP